MKILNVKNIFLLPHRRKCMQLVPTYEIPTDNNFPIALYNIPYFPVCL